MKKIIYFLTIICFLFIIDSASAREAKILKYRYYLIVDNSDDFIKSIKSYSSDKDSYLKFYSNRKIILKINESIAEDFKKFLRGIAYISDERVYRQDVSSQLIVLKTKLKTKKKLLNDLYALFNTSKFHQTLDIESEIGKVIMDIETIKGKIQYYADRISRSEITIFMNQRNIYKLKRTKSSRWKWIRSLGVKNMITNWNRK